MWLGNAWQEHGNLIPLASFMTIIWLMNWSPKTLFHTQMSE